MEKVKLSECLWRFLATVMPFAVGGSMWIFYQLSPPPLMFSESIATPAPDAKK